MRESTFTFQVGESLKKQFATIASARNLTGDQVLCDLMREFVQRETAEHNTWFCDQVQKGLDSGNIEPLVSSDEVEAKFRVRRAETCRKLGILE